METIGLEASIKEAALAVLGSRCRTIFVVSSENVLIGSVTEGDLVRAFLLGVNLGSSVRHVMNHNPIYSEPSFTKRMGRDLMRAHGQSAIPVIDASRKLLSILKQTD
jgi:CBS domain-containing protein